MTRCLGSLSVEAEQSACVDCKHRATELVIPGEPITKLEGKAQHPLSNRGAGEHVVGEMRRTLSHPAPAAARAEASTLAGERDQTIGAAARTPKPGKPMREHAAANESLKLSLYEQRGASPFVMSVELPEEGLEVLAHDAVQHPMLGGATHVRSRNRLARSRGVKVHDHRTPSRLVPLSAPAFSTCLR